MEIVDGREYICYRQDSSGERDRKQHVGPPAEAEAGLAPDPRAPRRADGPSRNARRQASEGEQGGGVHQGIEERSAVRLLAKGGGDPGGARRGFRERRRAGRGVQLRVEGDAEEVQ